MTIVIRRLSLTEWEARILERNNVVGFGASDEAAIQDLMTKCPRFSLSDDRTLYNFHYLENVQFAGDEETVAE